MEMDTRCVICNRLGEEGGHLFFSCKMVRPIWQILGLETVREMLSKTSSARDAVRKILELGEKISVQVVTLLWNWWLERNRVREGERRMEPDHLAYIVRKTSDEFLAMGSQHPVSAANRMKRWTRPPEDVLKINCDGAYRSVTSTGGWGFVIRDCDGQVIKAWAGKCSHLLDALHAELLACLAGVRAAGELGISKVWLVWIWSRTRLR